MLCLAAIAGSGLLLGTPRSTGTLGEAIGRLGAELAGDADLVGIPSPGTWLTEFAEGIERPSGSASETAEAPEEDSIPGILATAPWRSV